MLKTTRARTDINGDSLPDGALARPGTLRFRPGGFVSCLVFPPGGKTLVSGVANGTVCVFDVATGRAVLLERMPGPRGTAFVQRRAFPGSKSFSHRSRMEVESGASV